VSVLIDSSAWIDYFRGAGDVDAVDLLIGENLVVTNDLVLAELIPALRVRRQRRLIGLLKAVRTYPITIDWDGIIQMRVVCLRNGVTGVGIPDLIIAQNAMQHELDLMTADKHFARLAKHLPLSLY
jgi:predicted nucleic acid-binding protein